jgi:hypothetical protein
MPRRRLLMVQERIRPRLTITVDAETVNTVNQMVNKRQAKNVGVAFDLLANQYRLMGSPSGLVDARREHMEREVMEKAKAVLDEQYANLIKAMKEVIHLEVENVMQMNAMEEPVAEIKGETAEPELTFEQLLVKCPGTSSKQVEDWAVGWKGEIDATGHSIHEFVAAKMMRFQKTAKPVEVIQVKVENGGIDRGTKLIQTATWKMVEYWNEKLKPSSLSVGSKEFHVAYALQNLNDYADGLDNGHSQEVGLMLEGALLDAAKQRKWNEAAFMDDYSRIATSVGQIIEANRKSGVMI